MTTAVASIILREVLGFDEVEIKDEILDFSDPTNDPLSRVA